MIEDIPNLDEAFECRIREPNKSLEISNRYIDINPSDSHGYFFRHMIWKRLGDYRNALEDCTKAIEMEPKPSRFLERGEVFRALGDHARALADFNRAHDMDRQGWLTSFGPHLRADTLARLGRLDEALADAELLPEDHWMPEHDGLPGGDKAEFIAEIRRRAAVAAQNPA